MLLIGGLGNDFTGKRMRASDFGAEWGCALWLIFSFVWLGVATSNRADVLNLQATADTSITSGAPGNNAGNQNWINAGTDGPTGGNAVRRALLRFDLSSLPASATITSAVVKLTVTKVPAMEPVDSDLDLWRLLADWGEGTKMGTSGSPATPGEATWNARHHETATWTEAGAKSDAATTPSATTFIDATPNETHSWSGPGLVSDIQFWLANPTQNFGWLLTSQAEDQSRSVRGFASREDTANAGTLQIGYIQATVTNTPIRIANITLTRGTNAIVSWTGGTGAFSVQKKVALTDPAWLDITNTISTNVTVSAAGPSGFFQVRQATP